MYDAVRPASRVERLERKLAEMDEQDLQEALAARRHSVSATSSTPLSMSFPPATSATVPSQASYVTYPPVFDFNGYSFPNSMGTIDSDGTNRSSGEWQQPRALSAPDALVGLPGLGWTGTNTPSTVTGAGGGSMSIDWQSIGGANNLESGWDNGLTNTANGFSFNGSFSSNAAPDAQNSFLGVSLDPSSSLMSSPSTYPAGLSSGSPLIHPVAPATTVTGTSSSTSFDLSSLQFSSDGQSYIPALNPDSLGLNEDATRVQLHERDISQSARDYLLDLFFAPPREPFGSECWTEGQFRARLNLPPGQRPHSCLLLAIYMTAASGSYIPAVRSLADSLYDLAVVKLDEAIQKQDRILDATNAAKMLCKWLFARARALEAYQMAYKMVS